MRRTGCRCPRPPPPRMPAPHGAHLPSDIPAQLSIHEHQTALSANVESFDQLKKWDPRVLKSFHPETKHPISLKLSYSHSDSTRRRRYSLLWFFLPSRLSSPLLSKNPTVTLPGSGRATVIPLTAYLPIMSGFKRFELLESPFSFLYRETFLCSPTPPFYPPFAAAITEEEAEHQIGFALDLLNPSPSPLDLSLQCLRSPAISSFGLFDTAADLINFRRFQGRAEMELQLRSLCDRVTALEVGLGRGLGSSSRLDRKYKWTSEIKGAKEDGVDRKYKWEAEAKGGAEKNLKWTAEFKGQKEDGFDWKYKWTTEKKGEADRNVKWTAEIEGKGKHAPVAHKYTFQATAKPAAEAEENKGKKKEKEAPASRALEIEEKSPGAIAIRKVVMSGRCIKINPFGLGLLLSS